jgi:hypothetical protein
MRLALALATCLLVGACTRGSSIHDAASIGGDATPDTASSAFAFSIAPLMLEPAFSPDIQDYYVRCAAGANVLTVTMTASAGGTVALEQPTATSAVTSGSVHLDVLENQAIVIASTLGATTTEYWVRCLPHDFPKLNLTTFPEAGTVVPGYYLVGNTFYAAGESGFAMALDTRGTPVWYAPTVNGQGAKDVDMLAPDTISFVPIAGYTFGPSEGQFEVVMLDPVAVNSVASVGLPVDTHELRRLSNGHYLVFASPVVTNVDLTGLLFGGPSSDMLNCLIQEVDDNGNMFWQWAATDHFDPVQDSTWPQTEGAINLMGQPTTVVDPFHCNSIDIDGDGNLLVSARHMDSIFLINKSTGAVMWKMGGSTYTKDGAPFVQVMGDPLGGFFRQHDARFQSDGTISVFDDQTDRPGPARALVLSYDLTSNTASIVWQYRGASPISSMGSVTLLADGSRVIGWGTAGGSNPSFSEVTESGERLLVFAFGEGDSSYRAIKVPSSSLDIEILRRAVSLGGHGATDAGQDAGDAGTGDGAAPFVGCYNVSGSGTSETCTFTSSNGAGFSCTILTDFAPGSCPPAGLYGCCVETVPSDAGPEAIAGTCYYSASSGAAAAMACQSDAGPGTYAWQIYAP